MDCLTFPTEALCTPGKTEPDFKPVPGQPRPIFRQDKVAYSIFYAPNCLCVASPVDADWFETTLASPQHLSSSVTTWGEELCRRADLAVAEAVRQQQQPFNPECLTLYLNNRCNLRCVYCFTNASQQTKTRLNLDTITAAARLVAQNCREKNLPFYVAFHGGGEPTFYRRQVEYALFRLADVAQNYGVQLIRYIATNGVMSAEKAGWLANHFDQVGLSCDGPANIQNRQRPTCAGKSTASRLERTAEILHAKNRRFSIRATITKDSLDHQAEIADYFCRQLAPAEIRFEPVYTGGRSTSDASLTIQHAEPFVAHFLKAQTVAGQYNTPLTISGSRVGTLHGPYCNVFRSVLNLTADGVATACFKITTADQSARTGVAIGKMNDNGRFEINYHQIRLLRRQLSNFPPICAACFNRYHCTGECPDFCPLDDNFLLGDSARADTSSSGLGFRCKAQKLLTQAILNEAAQRLWAEYENNDKNISTQPAVYGTTTF